MSRVLIALALLLAGCSNIPPLECEGLGGCDCIKEYECQAKGMLYVNTCDRPITFSK